MSNDREKNIKNGCLVLGKKTAYIWPRYKFDIPWKNSIKENVMQEFLVGIENRIENNTNLVVLSHGYHILSHTAESKRQYLVAYKGKSGLFPLFSRNSNAEKVARYNGMIVPPGGIHGKALMFKSSGVMTVEDLADAIAYSGAYM